MPKQIVEGEQPKVLISRREVMVNIMADTGNGLALVDDDFADDMTSWALIHVSGERCSTQTAVTRCTYYQRYTSEEALEEAAKSYGGLTRDVFR